MSVVRSSIKIFWKSISDVQIRGPHKKNIIVTEDDKSLDGVKARREVLDADKKSPKQRASARFAGASYTGMFTARLYSAPHKRVELWGGEISTIVTQIKFATECKGAMH